jgi:hypothetical protein
MATVCRYEKAGYERKEDFEMTAEPQSIRDDLETNASACDSSLDAPKGAVSNRESC